MHAVPALAAPDPNSPLTLTTVDRRELGPHDVLIRIEYAGICHSDIHTVRGDWGLKRYPLVPGHEIAGIVTSVGTAVKTRTVGDRVGVGCLVNSCRVCAACVGGQEQHCDNAVGTYGSLDRDGTITQGGYSRYIVVTEAFTVLIPETLGLDEAAPLLCAGITTFSPLRRWGAGPGQKVAVVGLGGLGHIAVKIARAMGSEVTVLSQSLKKQEDGLRVGADHYYATNDEATFAVLEGRFDLIINTVSAVIDLNAYLRLLSTRGAMICVGAPGEPLAVNVFSLLGGSKILAGSAIGGIPETQEMLDFCAQHNIGAEVEVISADKVNEAYERVLASDVRYRFVIDAATIG
ncbi:NAD(P)-dependent alcohol dehydrogenase [Arthrobacter sp. K5]|uniref:alcohol dehydrogenase (NADP(+)) n=1 Tax=Arthrobacter sp. K5 TaxID=2839623 RepID=A0AAU8EZ33_9MICC